MYDVILFGGLAYLSAFQYRTKDYDRSYLTLALLTIVKLTGLGFMASLIAHGAIEKKLTKKHLIFCTIGILIAFGSYWYYYGNPFIHLELNRPDSELHERLNPFWATMSIIGFITAWATLLHTKEKTYRMTIFPFILGITIICLVKPDLFINMAGDIFRLLLPVLLFTYGSFQKEIEAHYSIILPMAILITIAHSYIFWF